MAGHPFINYRYLTVADFASLATQLTSLANCAEQDIQTIWIKPDETPLTTFTGITYSFDCPLYQKMIFRFRNTGNQPAVLFRQIDPGNQRRLLTHFGLTQPICYQLVELLADIANSYSTYTIEELTHRSALWMYVNSIVFFLTLPTEQQQIFIDNYNKQTVDFWLNRTDSD